MNWGFLGRGGDRAISCSCEIMGGYMYLLFSNLDIEPIHHIGLYNRQELFYFSRLSFIAFSVLEMC